MGVTLRGATLKYHYSCRFFTYWMVRRRTARFNLLEFKSLLRSIGGDDPGPRQRQVGSLAGAAHLSKDNAGVLRRAQ